MMSLAFGRCAARLVLASAFCLAALGAAHARDNTMRNVPHHAHDFYAVAPTHVEPEEAPAARGSCFTTNSPVEATKGIRHWSGRC